MASHKSNLILSGDLAWSYATQIKSITPSGVTLGNVTKYSQTTSCHQTKAQVRSCDILIDHVPIGCRSLIDLALQRGLIGPEDMKLPEDSAA